MSEAVLYVVATPIGNLADMTARAIEVLQTVSLIAAEDTRHSARLMAHFNIKTPMISVHDHNERQRIEQIVERLSAGESVALISDAGTPLISDPGFVLVRAVREAGFRVVPVPGCSALVTALCAAGLPSDRFVFEGFLPAKSLARRQRLDALAHEERTLIFYESTHRILASLEDMQTCFGPERMVVAARELTKTFETVKGAPVAELLEWMRADANQQKGEFVVLVQGAPARSDDVVNLEAVRVLDVLLEELPIKQAAALAAKLTGLKKNFLYQMALERRDA
ncbi:16S rRNA (cytidine(1402)-2'-O)-methyltransferase [Marinobacterium rhizophilum]|uniref:Ribosomal RNA small subunit methyltransferase I n=1 Tax=Marinobacterium rhizophilum TaxID=420402 RepID=A0ABY5HSF2_9GAMM|nr:16S rRNA (cytidine(1402)-2'-O)-methyltransferase [Marinobacterium rhizophilum]UTW14105.1 16S rRNA (cytidine(1402)-2'-O)-methyltransferase [Marinobacterium rhizophilum]